MAMEQPLIPELVPEPLVRLDPDKQYFVLNEETNEMESLELTHDNPLRPQDIEKGAERGASGSNIFASSVEQFDYNPKWLQQNAMELCDQMRKSDGAVRSVLQSIKLPLLRATWKVVPGDEDGGDAEDKKRAQKINDVLIKADHRREGWDEVLKHSLLMLDFGMSVHEIVWETDPEGFYYPMRLAPRLPQTIREFKVNPDGSLKAVIQEAPKNGRVKRLTIPGKYCVVHTHEKEGDNYWGVPFLRFLYQHWYLKNEYYKLDAVRLDRYAVGIPIIEVENDYVVRPNEKRAAETLLQGLRSHHRAYAILPAQMKLRILTPENEHGGASGLLEAIDHHDVMMARAALAHFLTMGQQKHGNYGTSVEWANMFLYGLQAMADQIGETFTRGVVRPIYDLNYDIEDRMYPVLKASSLENINAKELAASIYNLVLGQAITPDDELEQHLRRLYGMPRLPKEWTRKARGLVGQMTPTSPALASPNPIAGKPSDDDRQATKGEPTPGTVPSTTPQRGPIRAPGDRG